jgi:hypothetical protein
MTEERLNKLDKKADEVISKYKWVYDADEPLENIPEPLVLASIIKELVDELKVNNK